MRLDHIVIATSDVARAMDDFELQTGVRAAVGGPHLGLGTRNALYSFGDGSYLEIIGPDPEQELFGTRGETMATLVEPTLLHWAIQAADLVAIAQSASAAGIDHGPVRPMSRRLPSGEVLEWQLFGLSGHGSGGAAPFFIDWLGCPHPSMTAPRIGSLSRFVVSLPTGSALLVWLQDNLDRDVHPIEIEPGLPCLELEIATPRGTLSYEAVGPSGFSL